MNTIWLPLSAVAAVFLAVAGGASWWNQRRTIEYLRTELGRAEDMRRQLAEHLLDERRRGEKGSRSADGDAAERRRAVERALDPQPPSTGFPWLETLPSAEIEPSVGHIDLPG